jgi:predicted esterase
MNASANNNHSDMGHSTCEDELEDVEAFIEERLELA